MLDNIGGCIISREIFQGNVYIRPGMLTPFGSAGGSVEIGGQSLDFKQILDKYEGKRVRITIEEVD